MSNTDKTTAAGTTHGAMLARWDGLAAARHFRRIGPSARRHLSMQDDRTRRSALDLAREATELAQQARSTGHVAVSLAAAVLAAQYLQLAKMEDASRVR